MHANSVSVSIKSLASSYIPSFCSANSLVAEYVDGEEEEDGPQRGGDEGVDAVEDCVVPASVKSLIERLVSIDHHVCEEIGKRTI